MKKLVKESLNENSNKQNLLVFVSNTIENVKRDGGNAQNLLDADLLLVARYLEQGKIDREQHSCDECGWYTFRTLNLFRQFVESMANDEIMNNNIKDKE